MPSLKVTALPLAFSTSHAAHVILGGTDTLPYWGCEFQHYVERLHGAMLKQIGNPDEAPWRGHVEFLPADYIELQKIVSGLDSVKDPAHLMDQKLARDFARRCDIVGMHGGANGIGVGKDTVADALRAHGFHSSSFADPLKASLSIAYGIPLRFFIDRALKESPLPGCPSHVTPRKLMQSWGTEVVRSIEHSTWLLRHQLSVASAVLDLKNISQQHPERMSVRNGVRVCVPDVRFEDESTYVHELGGFNAWISRPSIQTANLSNGHVSEAGVKRRPSDLNLVNEGPLASFQSLAAREVLGRIASGFVAGTEAPTPRRTPKP